MKSRPGERPVQHWHLRRPREWHAVHQGWDYDLEIDTGAVDPQQPAALILAALADGKARPS